MSRFDKVDVTGAYRAPLAAAVITADVGVVKAVLINGSGQVARGAIASKAVIRGLICPDYTMAIGQPIDVMTDGEIVEVPGMTAGAAVYALAADGTLTATATSNFLVGWMIEADRMIVRLATV